MRRKHAICTEADEHRAGNALVSWAARETLLRLEATTDWPTHMQYAGQGLVALIPDGREVVWPPELKGGPTP